MKRALTTKFVAIEPVIFNKVESKVEGGFARIAQKVEVTTSPLIMTFRETLGLESVFWIPGERVILRGDAGLAEWNKNVLEYDGKKFVMCPLSEVLGFENEV